MRKVVLIVSVALVASICVAQNTTSPVQQGRADREAARNRTIESRVKKLDEKLKLTPDQEKKAAKLILARDKQMEANAKDTMIAEKERAHKVTKIRESFNAQFRAMLSTAQKKTWDAMLKASKAPR